MRIGYVWLLVWVWNPFHFDASQRWWVALILWSLETTGSYAYRIHEKA